MLSWGGKVDARVPDLSLDHAAQETAGKYAMMHRMSDQSNGGRPQGEVLIE